MPCVFTVRGHPSLSPSLNTLGVCLCHTEHHTNRPMFCLCHNYSASHKPAVFASLSHIYYARLQCLSSVLYQHGSVCLSESYLLHKIAVFVFCVISTWQGLALSVMFNIIKKQQHSIVCLFFLMSALYLRQCWPLCVIFNK